MKTKDKSIEEKEDRNVVKKRQNIFVVRQPQTEI